MYGYSCLETDSTCCPKVELSVVGADTAGGNAGIHEGVKVAAEVGVDGAKAGTGLGLTRIMCAAVGAGAL